jgi:hypothetical protein
MVRQEDIITITIAVVITAGINSKKLFSRYKSGPVCPIDLRISFFYRMLFAKTDAIASKS